MVLVFAAAISLSGPLDECAALFARDNPGLSAKASYGASNSLERQIREGAPVAVFVAASPETVDRLLRDGKALAGSRASVATGELVLIAPADSKLKDVKDLAADAVRRVAWGDPELVPAGKYAAEAMRSLGMIEKLEKKRVLAKDVRQVLAYVESGDADAGWVYRTDALLRGRRA